MTISEIKAKITAYIAGSTVLNVLTVNPSTFAIWDWIVDAVATAMQTQQAIFDAHRQDIDETPTAAGIDPWYVARLLEFQLGDIVQFNTNTFQPYYPTLDKTKQIVKYVAAEPNNGFTTFKVAKQASSLPVELDPSELSAIQDYLHTIQFSGAQVDIISLPADEIKLIATIYYNGQRILAEVQAETEAAITAYFGSLNFNGKVFRNKLVDVVQALGHDIDINTFQAKNVAGVWVDIDRSYKPNSGFFVVSPSFPLSTNLTYEAE